MSSARKIEYGFFPDMDNSDDSAPQRGLPNAKLSCERRAGARYYISGRCRKEVPAISGAIPFVGDPIVFKNEDDLTPNPLVVPVILRTCRPVGTTALVSCNALVEQQRAATIPHDRNPEPAMEF